MIHKIVQLATSKLTPYEQNPKRHPQEQVDKIAESIERYGFTVPIVTDGDHVIILGHGRLLAATKLGLKRVPCIVRDDLTEEQTRALRIADNRVAEGDWDIENLLAEIELTNDFTGFTEDEVNILVTRMSIGETDPDEEWEGMPEFDQPGEKPFRTIKVHFENQKAVDEFMANVSDSITEQTKYIWYPQINRLSVKDMGYEVGSNAE